jgi:ATP adenylyltransferase
MAGERTNLWAPWRIDYIQGLDPQQPKPAGPGCFLCDAVEPNLTADQLHERLVLVRDARGVLMMNRYPYTNGHLLAAPTAHAPDLSDMTAEQRAGLMELAELGGRLLQRAMNAQGLNIGMNIGRCAGAGVPGHLHLHIVPRWAGDVNFMEVTGRVRVIPQALEESYRALREALRVESNQTDQAEP